MTSLKCAAPEQCSLLCQRTLTLLSSPFDSLDSNQLCGLYEDDAGSIQGTYTAKAITKLCEGLKGSAVTSLGCVPLCAQASAFVSQLPS